MASSEIKEYIDLKVLKLRLDVADGMAKALGSAVWVAVFGSVFLMFFFFLNLTVAFVLSDLMGTYVYGFGAVMVFYFFFFLLFLVLKGPIQRPLRDKVARSFFNKEDDDEEED